MPLLRPQVWIVLQYIFTDLFFEVTNSEAQQLLSKLDARELHQRELAAQKLAALPAAKRPAQERLEQARQLEYDRARDLLIQKRNNPALGSQQGATGLLAHNLNNNPRLTWKHKFQRRITTIFCRTE
jgi:hypothetical protein